MVTSLGSLATTAAILGETHSSYYSLGALSNMSVRLVRNLALHPRGRTHVRMWMICVFIFSGALVVTCDVISSCFLRAV